MRASTRPLRPAPTTAMRGAGMTVLRSYRKRGTSAGVLLGTVGSVRRRVPAAPVGRRRRYAHREPAAGVGAVRHGRKMGDVRADCQRVLVRHAAEWSLWTDGHRRADGLTLVVLAGLEEPLDEIGCPGLLETGRRIRSDVGGVHGVEWWCELEGLSAGEGLRHVHLSVRLPLRVAIQADSDLGRE